MQSHLGRTSTSYRLAEARVLYIAAGLECAKELA